MVATTPKRIHSFAPATVANLGSCFDVMGLALTGFGDEVIIRPSLSRELIFSISGPYAGRLPADPQTNAATVPMLALAKHFNVPLHAEVELIKNMPIGSGLGSSAASACAGVMAAHDFLELGLTKKELIPFALEGEKVACGAAHADNVAPCLLGGIQLITSHAPLQVESISMGNPEIYFAVIHPDVIVKTEDARNVLPDSYPRSTVVEQLSATASLLAGLTLGNNKLVAHGLRDYIARPFRQTLIPCYKDIADLVTNVEGCLGMGISGSGPSIFCVCTRKNSADEVCKRITSRFKEAGIVTYLLVSQINTTGTYSQSNGP